MGEGFAICLDRPLPSTAARTFGIASQTSAQMKLVFAKGSGKNDVMEVFRQSAEPEHLDCPKQPIIPRDMVHCAVKYALQARGFMSRGEMAWARSRPFPRSC